MNIRKDLKRLYFALSIAWVLFCAVALPLKLQSDGQQRALSKYSQDLKWCDQHVFEDSHCYERTFGTLEESLDFYSFSHFWVIDIGYWKPLLFAVTVPIILFFGMDAIIIWMARGFKPTG